MARIVIVGGGPSGLMAAQCLAPGHRVALYDRMPTFGRKFLIAGRGGLNLTHSESLASFLNRYGQARSWLAPLVEAFSPEDLRRWAHDLGQETYVGSSGRVFPKSFKASPLLRAWLARLTDLGVLLYPRHEWLGWNERGSLVFRVPPDRTVTVDADAVLLALGGASWPRLGSNGAWAQALEAAGCPVQPFAPSNAGCRISWSTFFMDRFEGRPVKNVALSCNGQQARGDLIVTRTGLEGGPVYALSSAIRRAGPSGPAVLNLDLRPDLTLEKLAARLAKTGSGQSLSNRLRKVGLSPAASGLLREGAGQDLPRAPDALAVLIKALSLSVHGLSGLERAISSVGGVPLTALDDNLMLTARPGVFAAGEMLDWDAPTGGYLLQGCFAGAVAAARGIETWLAGKPS